MTNVGAVSSLVILKDGLLLRICPRDKQGMRSILRCLQRCSTYDLGSPTYACGQCGGLLEVVHPPETFSGKPAKAWQSLFQSRHAGMPGPDGSGVWRYREWVLPGVPEKDLITLGEGNAPLVTAHRLSALHGVDLLLKQCGHGLTGSFKDLGMTALISHVHHRIRAGDSISAVICASTGDTSAALAAYAAAANIPAVVLLPKGKITAAQLLQPLCHGARVVAIDTDFDGCMQHVQRLAEEGAYLANSKNSLRIEGQKTVAYEIAQGLGFEVPDWVVIPGGNLGNVSALYRGFCDLKAAGLVAKIPQILCAQAAAADPLAQAYNPKTGRFAVLEAQEAQATQASAIRIGAPVSGPKAVVALEGCEGAAISVDEQALCEAAVQADHTGFFACPHTAVALAAMAKARAIDLIPAQSRVVVVATAHGLKFTEFKHGVVSNTVPQVALKSHAAPHEVANRYDAVRAAVFD